MSRAASVDHQYPHIGLAAYFERPVWLDPDRVERLAKLLVDARWPWLPHWASYSGVHKRDDRASVRVGGRSGVAPLLEGMRSDALSTLRLNRARGDGNFTSVSLDLGRMNEQEWGWEAPLRLWVTCRCAELPAGKTIEAWISLAHELVDVVGAKHATMGVWPTFDMAISDTWLSRLVLDTPKGEYVLSPPEEFREQLSLVAEWKKFLGTTYARHPRWGTYLNRGHAEAIGGVEQIRADVEPAVIEEVGALTYVQLTSSIDTALTAEADERRRRLERLMRPILLGNPERRAFVAP